MSGSYWLQQLVIGWFTFDTTGSAILTSIAWSRHPAVPAARSRWRNHGRQVGPPLHSVCNRGLPGRRNAWPQCHGHRRPGRHVAHDGLRPRHRGLVPDHGAVPRGADGQDRTEGEPGKRLCAERVGAERLPARISHSRRIRDSAVRTGPGAHRRGVLLRTRRRDRPDGGPRHRRRERWAPGFGGHAVLGGCAIRPARSRHPGDPPDRGSVAADIRPVGEQDDARSTPRRFTRSGPSAWDS